MGFCENNIDFKRTAAKATTGHVLIYVETNSSVKGFLVEKAD